MQFLEAKLAAKSRAAKEAPHALEAELKADDIKHQRIYEVAAGRISALLSDPDHYMHGNLEKVEMEFKVKPTKPKGRVELFNQLVQQTPVAGQHKWLHHRHGVLCEYCGKKIKGCSTHGEISSKQATECPGTVSKTLKQIMSEMVQDTENMPDEQPGHRWLMRATNFSCSRCWAKIPLRSGKAVLERLKGSECRFGRMTEAELNLRIRVHPSHEVWRRGAWLECQKCGRTSKEQDGRVQSWMAVGCARRTGQLK